MNWVTIRNHRINLDHVRDWKYYTWDKNSETDEPLPEPIHKVLIYFTGGNSDVGPEDQVFHGKDALDFKEQADELIRRGAAA